MKKRKYHRKRKFLILIVLIIEICGSKIYGQEINPEGSIDKLQEEMSKEATVNVSENVNLEEYVTAIEKYVKDNGMEQLDIAKVTKDLLNGKSLDYKSVTFQMIKLFSKEMAGAITGAITILIIILIISVINALELEKKSDITKIAELACFFTLATIMISNFLDVINMFQNTVGTLSTLMQVISPFLMGVLMATGSITSTGMIQPMLLFMASAVGFLIHYIVIPFLSISVAFHVISAISKNLRLNKMAKLLNNTSLWIIGIVFTIFLGILSLESSLGTSVDALAVKTTQAAVSNFVPVVGKFFSDSFETVVGATKIISNVGGTLGILAIFVIVMIPVLKVGCIVVIYSFLCAVIEPICQNDTIQKFLSGFVTTYKTILGILIGISILFVISTGIVLNLIGQVVK